MRTVYHEHLSELAEQLSRLCSLAGAAMERATRALLQADLAAAEQVISDFADHAVEVGRRVVFQATGALPPRARHRDVLEVMALRTRRRDQCSRH